LQAEHEDSHGGNKAEKFIQKAAAGGQMEVQMGQLAQTKAQSQEVKSLGSTLVRDHTQANQKLQQLASSKNIQLDQSGSRNTGTTSTQSNKDQASSDTSAKHAKHQKELDKLQSQSGTEFDKAFVRMAIKDHKKDVAEFERARTDVNDPEIKAFIDETLPKLRNHLQMAQSAARSVGVDESSIAADQSDDSDTAAGAPASSTRGSDKPSSPASDKDNTDATRKDRSSLDSSSDRLNGATDSNASGTIVHNKPSASLDANVGDHQISADANVNRTDNSVSADVNTGKDHKVFQKGDGKVLGLSTDKNDGKFLGIIPDPKKNKNKDTEHDASVKANIDTDASDGSVGASAGAETGSSKKIDQ